MAPGGGERAISQQAFEDMVRENMEDLGMDPEEALEDAVQALTLQGVDLSGIIKCVPGVTSAQEDPVLQSLDALKEILKAGPPQKSDIPEIVQLLDRLTDLCTPEGKESGRENASIAARNGAVDLLCCVCSSLENEEENAVASGLKALSSVLCDIRSSETFQKNDGPKIIMQILRTYSQDLNLSDDVFSVVAAAATGNEIVKESFMDLGIAEIILKRLNDQQRCCSGSMYDAIRVLLTPDDDRVLASQVYGYARKLAQIGISDALVSTLKDGLRSPSSNSLCFALKAVAVNDEICRSISENGGVDAIIGGIIDSVEHNDKQIAKNCCSLLAKVAGSDWSKNTIVQKGGIDALIKLSSRFSDDPSVLQEIMGVITAVSLRSPENAARAIDAGAGDLAIRAMRKFPAAFQMQKQCCLMIRNLVVRNPENRSILLKNGVERLIRKAKSSNVICKDAASAALRDLALDDYN